MTSTSQPSTLNPRPLHEAPHLRGRGLGRPSRRASARGAAEGAAGPERLRDGRGATGRGGSGACGHLGKPLGRGHLRSRREASGPARGAQAPGHRGASAPARRRSPHRLSRLPQPALPPAGARPDPDRVLRPAAGLGLAAGPGADDRSARPTHPDALLVRDRDLPASRRRRRLRRPPGRGRRPAGARRALAASSQDAAQAGSAARQPRRRARPPLGGDGRGSGAARAPLRSRGRRRARARPAREPLPAGGRARHPGRRLRAAPAPRLRRSRLRRLGHGHARGRPVRRPDGRGIPHVRVQPRHRPRARATRSGYPS